MSISIKTPAEIEIMAEGGRRLGDVLRTFAEEATEGMTTKQLDRRAYQLIHQAGAKPAFLRYKPAGADHPYPFTLCTSVNDVVVHGQPSGYVIKKGDILKLDLGLIYKGFYLDSAITVAIGGSGAIGKDAKRLIAATKSALDAGIAETVVGKTLGDIGYAIERVAKKNKCAVAEGLTGHGIGRALHEDPSVWNIGQRGKGMPLEEGMVLAIEPMFVLGASGILKQIRDESWAAVSGSLAAHFEHTVAITKRGPRVLTGL